MPEQFNLASQIHIKIDGTEVQQPVMARLQSLSVEQHSHLPGWFTIRLQDPGMELLDNGPFNLTKTVEILAEGTDGSQVSLMKGEITALEPSFQPGMLAELEVRGFDKLHRLYRQTKTRAFLNIKDSDLAEQIARDAGITAEVEATRQVYEHIYQNNLADLSFLAARARRIGFECFIREDKLFFRKPPSGSAASTIEWGRDLQSFRPRISLAEQVDEVIVRGWDVEKQEAIVGKAERGSLYPQIQESKTGAEWAGSFGAGKLTLVNQTVFSQADADAIAAARLDELSGAYLEAEGEVFRRPDLRAGMHIEIKGVGNRLSGTYLLTSVSHQYQPTGLHTRFTVSGSRSGLLMDKLAGEAAQERIPFAVTGIVTNTQDPNDYGRVKVKFPLLADDVESNWARVIGIGAGPESGYYAMPDVGDEVLVIFENGSIDMPYVIGGLWNGQSKIPPESASGAEDERPKIRSWRSRSGHLITMYDNDKKKIEIKSADGRSITIDDKEKKITISTQQVTIVLDDSKIQMTTGSDINIKSSSNLKIEAGANIDIKAGGQVNINGSLINLN